MSRGGRAGKGVIARYVEVLLRRMQGKMVQLEYGLLNVVDLFYFILHLMIWIATSSSCRRSSALVGHSFGKRHIPRLRERILSELPGCQRLDLHQIDQPTALERERGELGPRGGGGGE